MPAAVEQQPVPAAFSSALHELGLGAPGEFTGAPLTGGVSSDIWRIDTAGGPLCAKRALAKLRVAADWRAPIERNTYEARWMRIAAAAAPGSAPQLLGQSPAHGVLVMRYLEPTQYALWKPQLRSGVANPATAAQVGSALGCIHAYAAARPELAAEFDSDAIFHDIRLEPYLLESARRHPSLAAPLEGLVETTRTRRLTLVHGDVSPKNILIGPTGPVFLDAECAWWGDPAFDLAFCLNHLLLKCLWTPAARDGFLACFAALAEAYLGHVDWEARAALEARAAALLPGLFLARVDGKSPVEYITEEAQRERVRRAAAPLLQRPAARLAAVAAAWRAELDR